MGDVVGSVARLLVLSIVAALWLIEHLRLAWKARTEGSLLQRRAIWLVPMLGAVVSWKRGSRFAPLLHAALVLTYLLLRLLPVG